MPKMLGYVRRCQKNGGQTCRNWQFHRPGSPNPNPIVWDIWILVTQDRSTFWTGIVHVRSRWQCWQKRLVEAPRDTYIYYLWSYSANFPPSLIPRGRQAYNVKRKEGSAWLWKLIWLFFVVPFIMDFAWKKTEKRCATKPKQNLSTILCEKGWAIPLQVWGIGWARRPVVETCTMH